jgi:hypothetical protein
MRKQKIFLFFLQASILTCAVSISISQGFLFLSFLFFWMIPEKRKLDYSPLFWSGIAIFGMYLLSFFAHLGHDESFSIFFSRQSEFKDLLLFSAFLLTHNLNSEERKKVKNAFLGLVGLLVFTGFLSIFSKVRLSILLSELFKDVNHWRFAHHYGDISGIGIHLPIGLMNTHLTFGGLLLLFAPFVFFSVIETFKQKKSQINRWLIMGFAITFGIVFLLNNARSALFGTLVGVFFGLVDYVFLKKAISPKRFLKVAGLGLCLIGAILATLLLFEPTAKTIRPLLGAEKHTDSGRTFIWNSTYPLIEKNPIFGIMPGNYNTEIQKTRKEHSQKFQELAFFYEVTQRGHAHNDFLHILATSGLLGVLAFLSLLYFILMHIYTKTLLPQESILFYGLIGFFFAGLFQCYFQDDEVVIVFWYLVGFLNTKSQNQEFS